VQLVNKLSRRLGADTLANISEDAVELNKASSNVLEAGPGLPIGYIG